MLDLLQRPFLILNTTYFMSTLGTKKFWKPAPGASISQKENQILKNSGYINIQLLTVNYMSKGNFWQRTFGGKDKIAMATTLKFETGVESIEATSVQDQRLVKADNNKILGLHRNIAIKIPAIADAIAMEVRITAVKDDALQAKFDMLNKPEYQSALQLAPLVVGQVLTVTSLVKKLFSDSDPKTQLDATFAGIISLKPEDNPVQNGKLTKGLLIIISTDEGEPFSDVDETKFSLKGDSLHYDNSEVTNTYAVFNLSFDELKGDDERSNWFKKYNEALNNLDKIQLTEDGGERTKILNDSKRLWIEGNALIDADISYINSERVKIKGTVIRLINEKFGDLTMVESVELMNFTDILSGLNIDKDYEYFEDALPSTSNFLKKSLNLEADSKEKLLENIPDHSQELIEAITVDTKEYLSQLEKNNIKFLLSDSTPDTCDDFVAMEEEDIFEAATCTSFPRPWLGRRWRVAESLKALAAQVNTLAPARSKNSDGTVGDLAHSQRDSDHNPWVLDSDGASGIVTAMDITHDPAHGCDCNALAKSLQSGQDKRIKYVIWNKQIMSSTVQPWTWRPYAGSNPHSKHIHISVNCDKTLSDSRDNWNIGVK